jgi:hypothetical protein
MASALLAGHSIAAAKCKELKALLNTLLALGGGAPLE